jgi:hypothetical protein
VLVGFVPPVVVSLAMLRWMPDLEKLKRSAFGRYIKKYMTPFIELTRLLTLVPMAYGAWNHDFRFIVSGLVIVVVAWCNGLIRQVFRSDGLCGSIGTYVPPRFTGAPPARSVLAMAFALPAERSQSLTSHCIEFGPPPCQCSSVLG